MDNLKPQQSTFPTAIECLISIVKAFGCSTSDRKALDGSNISLHDLNKPSLVDHSLYPKLIDTFLREPLEKYISKDFANLTSDWAKSFICDYMKFVGRFDLVGSTRHDGIFAATRSYFAMQTAVFLKAAFDQSIDIKFLLLVSADKTVIEASLHSLTLNNSLFATHVQSFRKEDKDKVEVWKKGENLPSLVQSIAPLFPGEDKAQIRATLLIARALDFFSDEKSFDEVKGFLLYFLKSTNRVDDCNQQFNRLREFILSENKGLQKASQTLDLLLISTSPRRVKNIKDKDQIGRIIDSFKDEPPKTGRYFLLWFNARFEVFSGNLKVANDLYALAFEESLYQGGRYTEQIIEEALVVAAVQTTPDKVFLKKLKNMAISFGYDIEAYPRNTKLSVSESEIEMWKFNFSKLFSKEGLFEGVGYSEINGSKSNNGPLEFLVDKHNRPDLGSLDRVISLGDLGRKMPQINYFIMNDKLKEVNKLLEKGASVDVMSEVGDTPLILSLTGMSAVEVCQSYSNKARQIFRKISNEKYSPDVVNSRTEKYRRTALVCAVDTCDPKIVKKVISLSKQIEIDKPALSENMTALYRCLGHIRANTKGDDFGEVCRQKLKAGDPLLLDTMRRTSGGLHGHTLGEQFTNFETSMKSEQFNRVLDLLIQEQTQKNMSISIHDMREIGKILLKAGANPNFEHNLPGIIGYTPLMFAAEIGELSLFSLMLEHGGDIDKTCSFQGKRDPDASARRIAWKFGSKEVLDFISSNNL